MRILTVIGAGGLAALLCWALIAGAAEDDDDDEKQFSGLLEDDE